MRTLKKFLSLSFVALTLILSGCNSPGLSGGKVQREYFTGGQIRSEFIMSDSTGRNGILKKYGYDGKVTSAAQIQNGKKNGTETWYDTQGNVIMTVPYLNGRKEGIQKVFYPDGKLMVYTTYRNDSKEGKAVKYNMDGSINEEAYFRNGERVR
ncbi:MAG: hypothetical protein IE885_03925 [Campylobacterales bacterium]|nr:hypothetical protein [Campylobacterales bacterium]